MFSRQVVAMTYLHSFCIFVCVCLVMSPIYIAIFMHHTNSDFKKILYVETGLVTDDDISQRESRLRKSLQKDTQYQLKEDSVVEIAQVKLVSVS